jgi:hypothetical protein
MRRWLALWVILAALFSPASVRAQGGVSFSEFEVDLWPEYDRREMLVIYRMQLDPSVSLPAEVSLRIPAAAGRPFNVAMQEVDGQLYNAAYTFEEGGDWNRVEFMTASPLLQIEYYDPNLAREGSQRSFEFQWPGDYPVTAMRVIVQQPTGADPVQIEPNRATSSVGADGLTYYLLDVGKVEGATPFSVRLKYEKTDESLTSSGLQAVQPAGEIDANLPGRSQLTDLLPYLAIVAGALLLIVGGFWFFSNRDRGRVVETRHRHAARKSRAESEPASGSAVYCSRCGKKAASQDAFCRSCGSRLRTS